MYLDGSTTPKPINFVYNPEDWAYISNWILRHHPDQRGNLFVAAAMGWNLALYLSNKDQ
jgi:hypothetical protein